MSNPLLHLSLWQQQKGEKGEEDRKLLDNVWGEVPEKQTTAIMGPSGAGKVRYCRGGLSLPQSEQLSN
jgi:ABC-type lipoprotein export system ATPase subunit